MSEIHNVPRREGQTVLDLEHRRAFRNAFLRVAPAMFLGSLDQTIVAAALPAMASSLKSLASISWVVTAYLLAATVAAPVYGRMGDAFGRKRMLIWALGLFLLGSIACAVAPNLTLLSLGRGLQGFGGGGLMTLSQAVLGEVVSPKERGRFQGWFGAIFALAATLGPVTGGFLAEHYGWRLIFWINVPLGFGATIAALRLKSSEGTGLCRLDYSGTFLFVFATVALLLCLSLGGNVFVWLSPIPVTLLLAAVAGFLLLARTEKRSADPLISPKLVERSIIWRSVLTVLLFASVLFGLIVQLPLFLQTIFGLSPTLSGLMLIPLTLAQVTVSTMTGLRIASTGRPRGAMVAGLLCVSIGFVLLTLTLGTSPVLVGLLTLLMGAGLGTTMPAAQTMVQWDAGSERLGVATAALSFSRSIGGVIGAAVTSAVLLGILRASGSRRSAQFSDSLLSGAFQAAGASSTMVAFRWMFVTLGLLTAFATVLAWSIPEVDLSASPSD